jgi:hypothetical protein
MLSDYNKLTLLEMLMLSNNEQFSLLEDKAFSLEFSQLTSMPPY